MSMENEIKLLREAVVTLTEVLRNPQGQPVQAAPVAPAPQAAPTSQAPAPTAAPAPVPTPPAPTAAPSAPAPDMPAPPSFAPPAAAPAQGAPFTDHKGLLEYVMKRYTELGADKGAQIQQVLVNLGYQNINDVKPEHYAQLHAGIEALT